MITPENIKAHIEAMIFTTDKPVSAAFVADMMNMYGEAGIDAQAIVEIVDELNAGYEQINASFRIRELAGGYKLLSIPEFDGLLSFIDNNSSRKKLSRAALETLSIIVYRQPVTKSYIESIRGVNSDYAVQKLLEKGLAKILGQSDEPGRPLLYGAGETFLEHFGLKDFNMLPKFKAPPEEEIIGAPDEETQQAEASGTEEE